MNSSATHVRLCDVTLRDGAHANGNSFDENDVHAIVSALDAAGAQLVEVCHGNGLGGSSSQYGVSRCDDTVLIGVAADVAKTAKIAVLFIPGIATSDDLRAAVDAGARAVRVATMCTEADTSEQAISLAKRLGIETFGFLMMSHLRPPDFLADQARRMESYGADGVYIVDSAGAMLPDDIRERVTVLRGAIAGEIGVHTHHNLGLGVANALAGAQSGATLIDGSLRGMGAGAGNGATELIAMVLEKAGFSTGMSPLALSDAAESIVRPRMPYQPFPDRDASTLGYAGVYSTFLLEAQRVGKTLRVDPREILLELGRRGAVAGQEKLIFEVGSSRSSASAAASSKTSFRKRSRYRNRGTRVAKPQILVPRVRRVGQSSTFLVATPRYVWTASRKRGARGQRTRSMQNFSR